MKKLGECLTDNCGSYILPFFWQHGDSQELLLEEIEAILESGAKEFCVESRIHQDFCCDKWWDDFGFILKEAKKRDMGVWLLDDKRFPSGLANEALEKYPHLKKKHIELRYIDVAGPKIEAAVYLPKIDNENEKIINVVAYKRSDEYASEQVTGEALPLMQNARDGLVFFDIPEGVYRVFFVIETRIGKAGARMQLVDMLNPDSTRLMLSEVYEPHLEHFKEYFGNTFRGFFSDEPCFGNEASTGYSPLGKENVILPVSDELLCEISKSGELSAQEVLNLLPFLWCSHTEKNQKIRYYYMDCVSRQYEKNFSRMLGDWCRQHGVMYIGHIIEDVNYHMRLGVGVGHYFRSMAGQDIAGCDIVLNQMIPGICDHIHAAPVGVKRADPEFFRYTLAKLCVSDAHLDPLKKGRALCEIFGAFGWAEGVPMMKQLADNMLVSGINYFVPHAFTNRYPCPDCPPHFYCNGKNMQFEMFGKLTRYMQRVCHLWNGAEHINNVAVLYNCEADWCTGDYELFQKISKILLQNQIDFDFVPSDYLDDANLSDGCFEINGEKFGAIVVSYSSALPKSLIMKLKRLGEAGVEVIFCEGLPERYVDCDEPCDFRLFKAVKNADVPAALDKYRDISLDRECKYLRYYHIKQENKDVYMFSNEDAFNGVNVDVALRHGGEYIRYNAFENTLLYGKTIGNTLKLHLLPSESCIFVFEEHNEEITDTVREYETAVLDAEWKITAFDGTNEIFTDTSRELYNLAKRLPDFAGKVVYEATVNVDRLPEWLSLGNAGEIATLYVNGEKCSDELFAPYVFDVKGKFAAGENKIRIEVLTNLGYRDRDALSSFLSLPPMGITGPVELKY